MSNDKNKTNKQIMKKLTEKPFVKVLSSNFSIPKDIILPINPNVELAQEAKEFYLKNKPPYPKHHQNAKQVNSEFEALTFLLSRDILEIKSLRDSKKDSKENSKKFKLTKNELEALKFRVLNLYFPYLGIESKEYFMLSKIPKLLNISLTELQNYME